MGIKFFVGGIPFRKLLGYSVVEDSSPVDISDTTGGTGQTTISLEEDPATRGWMNDRLELQDQALGVTRGTIRSMSAADSKATVTADGLLALASVEKTAQPFIGTLGDALRYYFGLVGIKNDSQNGIVIDSTLENVAVALPGWREEVWLQVNKRLAPVYGFEVALVSNNVVVRKLRQRIAQTYRDVSTGWSLDSSESARTVEVFYYNNTSRTNYIAYPDGGWNPDVDIFQADANETVVYEVELSSSLSSVQQPVAVDSVARAYTASSVYAVAGGDGLPITAAQWTARGGRLTVEIIENTKTLRITIRGASDAIYAPYRIAMSTGPSDWYSSLRIVGTGVFQSKQSVVLPTAVDFRRVTDESAPSVEDNEFIRTLTNAYDLGVWAAARYAGPKQTISVTSGGIAALDENNSYNYPTIADFNAAMISPTTGLPLLISDFNAIWAGQTIKSFNAFWTAAAKDEFSNQAFGNVVGSRLRKHDHFWRIRSSTITESQISYTAERDTTIRDFNDVWGAGAGATIADFNLQWAGKLLSDFTLAPLKRG